MPAPRGLVQLVDQELHRSGVLPRGVRLLVAVSGGADSVALLRLLHAVNGSDYWGWKLVVGHVDHGIRGAASAGDAKWVRELAAELGLAFVMRKFKLGKGASEEIAREARLGALRAMLRRAKCDAVVMGHHADDQAETVLMRLMRGCGIEGLGGMAAVAEVEGIVICRPLLGIRRAELRRHLGEVKQAWREDATNAGGDYLRNRVRAEVLPVMERLAPGAVEALGRAAALAQAAACVIERNVNALFAAAVTKQGARGIHFERGWLRRADSLICGEAIRRAVKEAGGSTETADFERVREAVRLVRGMAGGKRVELGGGVCLRLAGGAVIVERGMRR